MTKCNEDDQLGRLIYFTAQELSNFAEKVLKPHGLTTEQFHLLKNMPDERGLTQTELGKAVNKKPANMTRILDRLEKKGLLVRRHNPEDRRAALVFLTPAGRELTARVHGGFESLSARLVRGIRAEDQERSRAVMRMISRNLQEMTDELTYPQGDQGEKDH